MKRRFGVDPQYPLQRYVQRPQQQRRSPAATAKTTTASPTRTRTASTRCSTAVSSRRTAATTQEASPHCASLPVPAAKAARSEPGVLRAGRRRARTSSSTRPAAHRDKDNNLTSDAWTKILGADPLHYDYDRPGPAHGPVDHAAHGPAPRRIARRRTRPDDPLNKGHRDWTTEQGDLQYACTFPIPEPARCNRVAGDKNCQPDPDCKAQLGFAALRALRHGTKQLASRFAPRRTRRSAKRIVVPQLGTQGILGSLCPKVAGRRRVRRRRTATTRPSTRSSTG